MASRQARLTQGPVGRHLVDGVLQSHHAQHLEQAEGMRFLRESAVEKVLTGLTTLREINKVTFVE
mgnify:CR=1 FL=1